LQSELANMEKTHDLVTIGELTKKNVLQVTRGVEVGKLAYGSGTIPFIRTSDIANWELKIDPKHGVSEEIYSRYPESKKVKEKDILMVKDGTYLIGTTGIITKYDTKILFQSHIYRVRVKKPDQISPFLLLAILNSPIVKKQIRAKQFSQGIIDTIGDRIKEIILPVPKDSGTQKEIQEKIEEIVSKRAELKHEAREVSVKVQGKKALSPEDRILVDLI
jgi:type I restriction enzyme M protein